MKRKFLLFHSVLLMLGLFIIVLLPVNVSAYTINGDDVLTSDYDGSGDNPFSSTVPTQDELKDYTTDWAYGAFGVWLNATVYNFQKDDPASVIKQYLESQGLTNIIVTEEDKVEDGSTTAGDLTITSYDDGEDGYGHYGGWEVTQDSGGIDFWVVKSGGNQEDAGFTLWTYGQKSYEGYWTTLGIEVGENDKQPELSHFTAYSGDGDESDPIGGGAGNHAPEPSTFLLFGIGLLGLAKISRRKKSFQK